MSTLLTPLSLSYDADDTAKKEENRLKDNDRLGSCTVILQQLLSVKGREIEFELLDKKGTNTHTHTHINLLA
jgi:hypothetical protein